MIEPVRARSDHAMLEAIDHSSALHRWPSHSSAALSDMLSIDLQAGLRTAAAHKPPLINSWNWKSLTNNPRKTQCSSIFLDNTENLYPYHDHD